jgi:hypothetical protein
MVKDLNDSLVDRVHRWRTSIGGETTRSIRGAVEGSTEVTIQMGEESAVSKLKSHVSGRVKW